MADRREEVAFRLCLLVFHVALAAAKDPKENEHERERENVEYGLDQVVSRDRTVHFGKVRLEDGTPVVGIMLAQPGRNLTLPMMDVLRCFHMDPAMVFMVAEESVERMIRSLAVCLADPYDRQQHDHDEQGYPYHGRAPEAVAVVMAEYLEEEGDAGYAPQKKENVGFRRHHGDIRRENRQKKQNPDHKRKDQTSKSGCHCEAVALMARDL